MKNNETENRETELESLYMFNDRKIDYLNPFHCDFGCYFSGEKKGKWDIEIQMTPDDELIYEIFDDYKSFNDYINSFLVHQTNLEFGLNLHLN